MAGADFLAPLFLSGRIVDLILAFTVLEVFLLLAYRRLTGRGVAPGDFLANILSGLCLMLALRCALTGAGWDWIALCLFGSLVAHLTDLWRRWR